MLYKCTDLHMPADGAKLHTTGRLDGQMGLFPGNHAIGVGIIGIDEI